MTLKGSTQKPKHPPVKNYADYIKDEVKAERMTEKEGKESIRQAKSGNMVYSKKTYTKYR